MSTEMNQKMPSTARPSSPWAKYIIKRHKEQILVPFRYKNLPLRLTYALNSILNSRFEPAVFTRGFLYSARNLNSSGSRSSASG